MMKKLFWFLVLFSGLANAQIYNHYPEQQEDYINGNIGFYKDFHKIVTEKGMKPCGNKNEFYVMKVVVYPDKTIKYVKPEDTVSVNKNKCTFELTKSVLKYMSDWKPAVVDGKKVAAVTSFMVVPDDLFENYKENYDAKGLFKQAEYEGGMDKFRKKVLQNIDISKFWAKKSFRVITTFMVNEKGEMEDVKLLEETPNKEFNAAILSGLRSIKNKWRPATFRGVAVPQQYKLPLGINYN